MFKQTTVLFLLLAVGLALVLFSVKYKVQDLKDELTQLNHQIAAEHQTIHVLDAEFSYLVDAKRLHRLSARYLNLAPVLPDQIGTFASLRADRYLDNEADTPFGEQPAAAARPAVVQGGGQ
jgi:hypothetical protein